MRIHFGDGATTPSPISFNHLILESGEKCLDLCIKELAAFRNLFLETRNASGVHAPVKSVRCTDMTLRENRSMERVVLRVADFANAGCCRCRNHRRAQGGERAHCSSAVFHSDNTPHLTCNNVPQRHQSHNSPVWGNRGKRAVLRIPWNTRPHDANLGVSPPPTLRSRM